MKKENSHMFIKDTSLYILLKGNKNSKQNISSVYLLSSKISKYKILKYKISKNKKDKEVSILKYVLLYLKNIFLKEKVFLFYKLFLLTFLVIFCTKRSTNLEKSEKLDFCSEKMIFEKYLKITENTNKLEFFIQKYSTLQAFYDFNSCLTLRQLFMKISKTQNHCISEISSDLFIKHFFCLIAENILFSFYLISLLFIFQIWISNSFGLYEYLIIFVYSFQSISTDCLLGSFVRNKDLLLLFQVISTFSHCNTFISINSMIKRTDSMLLKVTLNVLLLVDPGYDFQAFIFYKNLFSKIKELDLKIDKVVIYGVVEIKVERQIFLLSFIFLGIVKFFLGVVFGYFIFIHNAIKRNK